MSKAELLRITMSEAQVKDACREFAEARAAVPQPCAISVEFIPTHDTVQSVDSIRAEVVFTRKLVRASKAETQS